MYFSSIPVPFNNMIGELICLALNMLLIVTFWSFYFRNRIFHERNKFINFCAISVVALLMATSMIRESRSAPDRAS